MGKIKIVFIMTSLDFAGTEKQFIETVRRLDRQYFELHVLAFSSYGKLRTKLDELQIPFTSLEYSGIQGKFYPQSYLTILGLILKMVRYFQREKPDIVQSYLFWGNIYGALAARLAGISVVLTGRRDTMEECRQLSRKWLQNFSNILTTAVVANSENVRQHCLTHEKFLSSSKIQVIRNGIELEDYTEEVNNRVQRRSLHISEKSHVIGIIARLNPRKGHRDFLKAASLVLRKHPGAVFLIIGKDQGIRPDLEMLAQDLKVSHATRFLGEREDVPEILSVLDILVSSSYVEGLSNAILEAMAAGKPVVATDIAGSSELIVHEKTGLLVPPHEPDALAASIMRLLEAPGLRGQFGKAARKRAAELFSMQQMIERTEHFYQGLMMSPSGILEKK